ncbi:single-stranded DNA-binding protein [Synechococcus sp. PROS-U-1]|jgi:single-stranded DNA-binding protein|uniref:single-stranded DNA-binding protein n=1 Tax=Synechococcus sp. PROS-U-1 TaxID=1400866 RepID=UPI0016481746|nr:single-stranded DNA-binding protein [Synechococcus sp. PROS-U-1]
MNHCVLEVEVIDAPTVRYTQDNQTPIAEMAVRFDALREGDPPGELKVVGWGNLAQELQNRVQTGQRLLIEGRLRMNTMPRGDGMKEKRAEFTLARLHPIGAASTGSSPAGRPPAPAPAAGRQAPAAAPTPVAKEPEPASWNAAPLVPDTDDIPF